MIPILENMTINSQLQMNESELSRNNDGGLAQGLRYVETPMKNGGWKEMFENKLVDSSDIDNLYKRPGGFSSSPDRVRALTAIMLENTKQWLMSKSGMSEATTRASAISGFQDFLFPIIRYMVPMNPLLDMVSIQPMTRRIGQVFFQHIRYGSAKGNQPAGGRLFDALRGYRGGFHFSDEFVENEQLTASGVTSGSGTLQMAGATADGDSGGGIRPGSVVLRWYDNDGTSVVVMRDDSNGNLVKAGSESTGTATVGASTINYVTGAYTIGTISAATGSAILCSYEYDSEGMTNIPSVDFEFVASPITAKTQKLRYRWTMEAEQDYGAEFGASAGDELARATAATLVTEQARLVLGELWEAAGAPYTNFNYSAYSAGNGYTKREYLQDMQLPFNQVINSIYSATQRYHANVALVDVPMMNLLNAIGAPHFAGWSSAGYDDDAMGIKFIGMWDNRVRVYVDSRLNELYPGAAQNGNALFFYKGRGFTDAGYVWAPYMPIYSSPQITLDDMVNRRAVASRNGRKLVNRDMYARVEIL